ncbi:MAG TPA: SUMF1/EgtB/PvdO family nonheme iron enzyme [Methylomirabilota bacterium]|nr:SUMF1/EgtB/PvdO family nonheme iron enzyme [Methylomirabilota bacterium]
MIATARRRLARGGALALAGLAVLVGGTATGPRAARADGIMLIEAGAFWMGSDTDSPDEAPLHRVYVRDFWLDRHKVTNREYARFLEARGLRSAEGLPYHDLDDPDARIVRSGPGFAARPGFEDHPAVEVTWVGARDYCLWRGRRLPTEAEWEKAARGADRRRYPWGDEPPTDDRAVVGRPYGATDRGDRRPAGAGPGGVQDLLGNLREWTSSAYRPYPYRADDGRESAPLEAGRVVRGASHDDPLDALRVTIRRLSSYDEGRGGLAHGHHHTGFRCATSEDLGGR